MKISLSCSNLTLSKRICLDQNQNSGTAKHRKHPETLMFYWQTIRENIIAKNILINKSEIVIVISFFFRYSRYTFPAQFLQMIWLRFQYSDQTYSSDVISKWTTQEVLKSKFTDQRVKKKKWQAGRQDAVVLFTLPVRDSWLFK